jgi:hypothetical protein
LLSYDPSVTGYAYNLTRAAEEFQQIPNLWETGFTMTIVGDTSPTKSHYPEFIKSSIESLNPKFHITTKYVPFTEILPAGRRRQLPILELGYVPSWVDPYEVARLFYHSNGSYAARQLYSNPTMDSLIDGAVRETDPTKRAAIYHDIQVLAVEDCSCMMLFQLLLCHFERDWIVGWYYNPSYVWRYEIWIYAYNLWKWYYVPQALMDNSTQPTSSSLPVDVNYDGIVNIIDIAAVAKAFESEYGPPIDPRWNFRADIDNNRVVNILDIGTVAKNFGQTSTTWVPPP